MTPSAVVADEVGSIDLIRSPICRVKDMLALIGLGQACSHKFCFSLLTLVKASVACHP